MKTTVFTSLTPYHGLKYASCLLGVVTSGVTLLMCSQFTAHANGVELPPGPRGNFTLTVQDIGSGNVRYSLSGSATNRTNSTNYLYRLPANSNNYAPSSGEIPGYNSFLLPSGLSMDVDGSATQRTAGLGGEPFHIRFENDTIWYLSMNSGSVRTDPGQTVTGGGTVSSNIVPFSAFVPGTFYVLDENSNSWFDATYIVIPFSTPPTNRPGGVFRPKVKTILITDTGAINSTNSSGLSTAAASRQLIQGIGSGVFRDLNSRLFRSRGNIQPGQTGAVIEMIPEGDSDKDSFVEQVAAEERAAHRKFELFTEFDYGYYGQDSFNTGSQGYEADTFATTIGGEMRPNQYLAFGLGASYVDSDAHLDNNFGSINNEGYFVTGYVSANRNNFWGDMLYSYGTFDTDTNRNTFIGSRSRGSTESDLHYLAMNVGYTMPIANNFTLGPWGSLDYLNGSIDGYEERGNARANLIFPDDNSESLTSRLGMAITHATNVSSNMRVTTQLRAAWAHEFMPDQGSYGATLETSPFTLVTGSRARSTGNFTATSADTPVGSDWLELGAGVRLDLQKGFNIAVNYEGAFGRSEIDAHMMALTLGYEW